MTRWAELIGALTLLTRLPVGGWTRTHPPPADCVWAYPLVGLIVGVIEAGVLTGGRALGLHPAIAAVLAVATAVIVSGALHEDGLADTADGFGGGRTREQKLAIMRDSRIGTYGALALTFSLILRITALTTSSRAVVAIILAQISSRAALVLPLLCLKPARPDGLGLLVTAAGSQRLFAALALAAVTMLAAPWSFMAAIVGGYGITCLARRQIGGYTGDILGAVQQTSLCASLIVVG